VLGSSLVFGEPPESVSSYYYFLELVPSYYYFLEEPLGKILNFENKFRTSG